MSILEWLVERYDSGPIGTIDSSGEPLLPFHTQRVWIIIVSLLGLFTFGFFVYIILENENQLELFSYLFIYIVVSWLFTAKPNYSNLGWLGGLMNNPFRFSDNINRFLLFLNAALLPGKLIVFSIQSIYRLIKYNR